jgi:hypothetical protein
VSREMIGVGFKSTPLSYEEVLNDWTALFSSCSFELRASVIDLSLSLPLRSVRMKYLEI